MPLSAAARELCWVPKGGIVRRDLTAAAAATRTGPVEAARAYASRGNDARQAAAAFAPTAAASGKMKLEGRLLPMPPTPQRIAPEKA
ncbi:hypothetical protein P7K49_007418, partial [Saguinus oedipus]